MVDFRVKEVKTAALLKMYKPVEIWGHCSNCGNHGKIWSCPPHAFDPVAFLKGFNFAYVMIGSISLVGFEDQSEAMDHYYAMRRTINHAVLKLEERSEGSVCLYAGHCEACEDCTRIKGGTCGFPEKSRYSLESLGLKVSDIMETCFDEKLQWAEGKIPEKLLTVPALLSMEPMPCDLLISTLKQDVASDQE